MYLLDTNACIRILNNSSPTLIDQLKTHQPDEVAICSIVKAELIFGAYGSSRTAENLRLLNRFFEPYYSLPFDDRCVEIYGRIRSELRRSGRPIGPYDLLIASIAIVNDRILVTANIREFERVAGLSLENWEEPI
jgi:tRNA(fMet)-specific endonuclease VapC